MFVAGIQVESLAEPDTYFRQRRRRADLLYTIQQVDFIEEENNKEEVEPIENPIPELMAVRPVRDVAIP